MNEPRSFDPISVLVDLLQLLTGPSSWLVWLVLIVNGVVGWVTLVAKAASVTSSAAAKVAAYRSRIPAVLVIVMIQSTFFLTGAMIALQWGEVQILDKPIGPDLQFLGGDFEIARQSFVFWLILIFNLAFLGASWAGDDVFLLTFGLFIFLTFAVGVVVLLNHTPASITVHGIYFTAAIISAFFTRKIYPETRDRGYQEAPGAYSK